MTANVPDGVRRYFVSAHPYAFDAWFLSTDSSRDTWVGPGYVMLQAKGGGVHQAWALVEADRAGREALQDAGFTVLRARKGPYAGPVGGSCAALADGGAVSWERDRAEGR